MFEHNIKIILQFQKKPGFFNIDDLNFKATLCLVRSPIINSMNIKQF